MFPLLAYPRQPSGYTYTIASRASHAMCEVESLFGPRVDGFFYAGHEFSANGPQTWFPGNCGHVVIQLSLECMNDYNRAVFQISHEVVHLLSPQIRGTANNLEEGLATWFQERYTLRETGQTMTTTMPCYSAAKSAVSQLLSIDPDSVRKMREIEPCLASISEALIRDICPSLPETTARFLAARFVRSA